MNEYLLAPVRLSCACTAIVILGDARSYAQSPLGPRVAPPPSYGAPTALQLAGYEEWTFHPYSLTVTVSVHDIGFTLKDDDGGMQIQAIGHDPARATGIVIMAASPDFPARRNGRCAKWLHQNKNNDSKRTSCVSN